MNALTSADLGSLAGMGEILQPFIGSEALASGALNRYDLRTKCRAIMPNVYIDKQVKPTLADRAYAAWLWSHREAVVAGAAASAFHGAKWVDDDSPVELIWRNARAPEGVVTRCDLLLEDEVQLLKGVTATTPGRTAFDLGRRDRIGRAVARLDALARATDFKTSLVAELADRHPHTRGLRQLEKALVLVDAGAESPKETWLRLLVIRDGYPRPRTQIPVFSADGSRRYFLDMGWDDIKLALEYEGDHHRLSRERWAYEIKRLEDIAEIGWLNIRVAARHHPVDVLRRVHRAWEARTR